MTMGEATIAREGPAHEAGHVRRIAAGAIGNVLEWYDFAVYGYLAATIGRQFFPSEDPAASLLSAFAVFAVGFLMRPIGGILIGHIGDRHGRRIALIVSVAGMAVPTVMIGVLPGYDAIGLAAPILLVLLRMVQGMSVGGEYVGSMVFLVESAPADRRGVYGAFAGVGAVGGILLGSASATLLAALLPAEAIEAWAWRLPFLAGLVLAIVGFVLRREMAEPAAAPREHTRLPIVEAVREHPWAILRIAGLSVFNAVGFYVSFVYVATWLQTEDGLGEATALEVNTLNMVILLFVIVGFCRLSDRIGRKPILTGAAIGFMVLGVPLFWLMDRGDVVSAFLGQLGLVAMVGALGVMPTAMVETVAGRVRVTAIALGYNLTLGFVGGTAPLVAAWLIDETGDPLAPGFFVAAAGAVSFVAIRFFNETAGRPLQP